MAEGYGRQSWEPPTWAETIAALKLDLDRYVLLNPRRPWWLTCFLHRGFGIGLQYRLSQWVHYRCRVPGLRVVLKSLCWLAKWHVENTSGCEISNQAILGPGLLLNHAQGIMIHGDVEVGRYCNISHQVTLGAAGRRDRPGAPRLGEGVFVGPGAKIFGPITLGDNVAVGANAVVTRNVPDNAVVVGIPAQVINYKGAADLILR